MTPLSLVRDSSFPSQAPVCFIVPAPVNNTTGFGQTHNVDHMPNSYGSHIHYLSFL